jgi:hypothetical protein
VRAAFGEFKMLRKKKETIEVVEVQEIRMRRAEFYVLGSSPLLMERFDRKAWEELLLPTKRESRATLEQKLKHDPVAEFRGRLYLNRDKKRPTLFHLPNGAFHCAMCNAALDIPGPAKAKMERNSSIVDMNIDLYGLPFLKMDMVRNSDMARTPDVRTRPIFPRWACMVTVEYNASILTERSIANLFGGSGIIVGIGGWRPQKGGTFGKFELVNRDDMRWRDIVSQEARKAQQAAFDHAEPFDEDTHELLTWFNEEVGRREMTSKLTKVQNEKTGNGSPESSRISARRSRKQTSGDIAQA